MNVEEAQRELGELIEGAVVLRQGDTVMFVTATQLAPADADSRIAVLEQYFPDITIGIVSGTHAVLVRREEEG